ncbi:hypothetical protein PsYK624_108590 [Phanerochaete sordida]|uniref:Uncharacterized protein n=1 Tax=Phanerochaete sordida TaxID=48140 RepID=A0A9P3GGV7_9APHY|nr:hypothetical protein PsYK624_108590 [Phanerochaete sordida]
MTTAYPEVERTDMFEQLFQRLEEESERRALEEEERDTLETKAEPSPVATVRERRRGSISISRVGGQFDTASSDSQSHTSSRGSRTSSMILTRRNFYQLESTRTDSTDSFASETTTERSADDVEDTHHVAQTHFIPAQSISKAISRRLSRAKDLAPLSPTSASTVIIGVAVEASTVEHHAGGLAAAQTTTTTTVYSGTLRPQRSTPLLNDKVNFLSKAKDITSKLRRKSVAALTPASR